MPVGFKLGQLFIVTVFCVLIFAKAYAKLFNISPQEALYISLRIQTLSGSNVLPRNELQKVVVSFQSVIAYLITSGLIIVSVN